MIRLFSNKIGQSLKWHDVLTFFCQGIEGSKKKNRQKKSMSVAGLFTEEKAFFLKYGEIYVSDISIHNTQNKC